MKLPVFVLTQNNKLGSHTLSVVFLLIAALFLSITSGILAAYGNLHLLIALLGVYGALFVLIVPSSWIVWMIFFSGFLITGPSAYFVRFTQIQWLTALISVALILPLIFNLLRSRKNILLTQFSINLFLPIAFVFLAILSSVINQSQLADFVSASRHYLFMWPLMLVLAFGLVPAETVARLWKALLIVAALQLPMALYQYFYVARQDARMSPWDAVIGTFQGNIEGGGDSAAMAMMLIIAMLTSIALWREQNLKFGWMIWIVITGIATMVLAEVKAMVILLPVPIAIYYRKELVKKPIETVVVMIGVFLLAWGILTAYKDIHYSTSATQVNSAYDSIISAITPNPGEDSAHVGRVTLLVNWWNSNVVRGEVHSALFGHGIGATHSSKIQRGKVASLYEYKIAKTTSVILLWETGILGHLIFLMILLFGAKASADAAKAEYTPSIHRVLLRVGAISLILLVITLPYSNFHLLSIPTQFLMMLMLGQALYWSNFIKSTNVSKLLYK